MIVNGQGLLRAAPIKDMLDHKAREHGVSHGLSEAGYDIRIAQDVTFYCGKYLDSGEGLTDGRFCLASSVEDFNMPTDLVGLVKDKSTWARRGLSVFNTVIEPGWKGFLTLELVYHGDDVLTIPAGAGIVQVLFQRIETVAAYGGKYQNQPARPVQAIMEKG
jgi:dCTP deaminase